MAVLVIAVPREKQDEVVVHYIGDVLVGIHAKIDAMAEVEKRVVVLLVLVFAKPEHAPSDRHIGLDERQMPEGVAPIHIMVQLIVESAEIPPAFIPRRTQGKALFHKGRWRRRRGWLPVRSPASVESFSKELRC